MSAEFDLRIHCWVAVVLPESVGLPHSVEPQAHSAVLRARAVDLTVRTVADTVHRTKVAFVGLWEGGGRGGGKEGGEGGRRDVRSQ